MKILIFFSKIKEHYSLLVRMDETVPDFGEVKISYGNSFSPIFLGTGHNFVYLLMQILHPIATMLGNENQIKEILMYVKNMIFDLEKYNKYCEESSYGDLYLPTEDFFYADKRYYKTLENNELTEIMKYFIAKEDKVVDKIHFIQYENKFYPLFNLVLLLMQLK